MNKVLILNGSPKGKRGHTSLLVEAFLEGYQSGDKECIIDHVELCKSDIHDCIGCFNCWTKTPGKCVFNDDASLLIEKFINADLIIWATPLYHHGMTSILKTFVERTLPFNEPYIVKEEHGFTHPERFVITGKKNIIISNCGFPEYHNFDIMRQTFDRVTHNSVDESILCVMGELLSKKPLQGRINWYYDCVKSAGTEYAISGEFKIETREILKKPLVPIEDFIEMANLSWEAEGEIPPSLDVAMGRVSTNINNTSSAPIKVQKGLNQMKLMRQSFVADNADGMDFILEIEFTDLDETHHFIVKDNKCELIEGKSAAYTTKIITPYDVWMQVSDGELDASKAMMDGLYKIDGDFSFMMKMGRIFGSGDSKNVEDINVEKNPKVFGIRSDKWMSISFAPWIMSWICIGFSSLLGLWIPLLVNLLIVSLKKKGGEVTYFEKMSALYFSILAVIYIAGMPVVGEIGTIVNYFSMALIWSISIVDKKPLTSDYSKHKYEGDISANPIFIKTNEILTLFWSLVFIIQGSSFILLGKLDLLTFAPLLYILTVGALIFTGWFSNWYPEYIAKGK